MAQRAADTYVLASAEKIGAASRFAVLPLTAVAAVITDAPPHHDTVQRIHDAHITIIHA